MADFETIIDFSDANSSIKPSNGIDGNATKEGNDGYFKSDISNNKSNQFTEKLDQSGKITETTSSETNVSTPFRPVIVSQDIKLSPMTQEEIELAYNKSKALANIENQETSVKKWSIPWWVWVLLAVVLIFCLLFAFGLPQKWALRLGRNAFTDWIATRGSLLRIKTNGSFLAIGIDESGLVRLSQLYDYLVFKPYLYDISYDLCRKVKKFNCSAYSMSLKFTDSSTVYYLAYYDIDADRLAFCCKDYSDYLFFRIPNDKELFYNTNIK